jgi:hypothetical protein
MLGGEMTTTTVDPRTTEGRRDTAGRWHHVAEMPCEWCGCPWAYSLDEPGVFWEPGPVWSRGCEDRACDCHTAPFQGMPATLHAG